MKKYLSLIAIVALIVAISYGVHQTKANVFIFPPSPATATATSTYANIGIGVGTTTLLYDAYASGQTFATEGATVLVIDSATTTAAVLNISLQYSQQGGDWYADDINLISTTTGSYPISLSTPVSYQFKPAGSSTTMFAFPIMTPTRYVRAVFSSTGATSSIFARIVPIRQQVQ